MKTREENKKGMDELKMEGERKDKEMQKTERDREGRPAVWRLHCKRGLQCEKQGAFVDKQS